MKKRELSICLAVCAALLLTVSFGAGSAFAGVFQFEGKVGYLCRTVAVPPSLLCTAQDGFWGSSSIVVSPDGGTIYVTDIMNARIEKYDSNLNFLGLLTRCPDLSPQTETYCTDEGEINYSPSMAVSPGGDFVYVSDPRNYRIHKFDAETGSHVLSWGLRELIPWLFREPSGVAVDEAGDVYVTDILDSAILKFNPNGIFIARFIHPSATGDDFRPTGIFATASGFFVTDYLNSTLYQFQHDGQIINSWGGFDGTAPGEFTYPASVTADAAGNLFIADTLNSRIQAKSGDTWTAYGGSTAVEGTPIDRPFGIAADDMGHIYVADTFRHRVLKYSYIP